MNKFKNIDRISATDLLIPKTVFLSYGVCAVSKKSCGWRGWIIESVYAKTAAKIDPSGDPDIISSADNQSCPNCHNLVYRTDIQVQCTAKLISQRNRNKKQRKGPAK